MHAYPMAFYGLYNAKYNTYVFLPTNYLVMQKYCVEHDNIIFLENKKSLGACTSRNNCIKKANGKFITGLDDDDLFHPDRIRILMENYNENQ